MVVNGHGMTIVGGLIAAERALFARIRSAFDPAGTLNPNVLPR